MLAILVFIDVCVMDDFTAPGNLVGSGLTERIQQSKKEIKALQIINHKEVRQYIV
jgi:hypothetical protein